jgi:hypothetical protein
LRGSHETFLLDRGTPVHVVAKRCGHDPATLLRSYAKRTEEADAKAAGVIGSISKGILGQIGSKITKCSHGQRIRAERFLPQWQ